MVHKKIVLDLDRLTLFFKHIVAMFDIFSNRELYTDLQLFFIYIDNDLISGIKYKRNIAYCPTHCL